MTAHRESAAAELDINLRRARRARHSAALALFCFGWITSAATLAEDPPAKPEEAADPAADAAAAQAFLDTAVPWQKGPAKGDLNSLAEIQVPAEFRFTGREGTQKLMKMFGNLLTNQEAGLIAPHDVNWFIVFEFEDVGYVKDEEKLDPDAMMKAMKANDGPSNEERKRQGLKPLYLEGWEVPPAYDPETKNLTWAIRLRSENHTTVNYFTKVLGRKGVMNVTLVGDPEDAKAAWPKCKELLRGYEFTAGNRYAEFRPGDKIAQYGLTALVAGGLGAVALKTGLLQKFWKLIVIGVVALLGGLKALWGKITGSGGERQT
ncbi:MAG: DUF2167 domain-containing protein [Phycisphaerae bacterium]|nr:DUF2167 domain-containing protein [Phycisphaerae bacterium]